MPPAAARLYDCFVLKWNLHGDAFAQPGFFVQTVRTPAVLVHCQRSLSTALSTGVDRVRLIEAYAALDAVRPLRGFVIGVPPPGVWHFTQWIVGRLKMP